MEPQSAVQHSLTPQHFEPHSIEGRLQQMDAASIASDDQFAVGPLGIFMSADEEFQGELFEDVIVGGLEIVIGQRGRRLVR